MAARQARDNHLLDAIEALPVQPFTGTVYRVVRDGRDPLQCSRVGGRWDDQTFDVLYTATRADGALGEMYFHLSRGQPVMPSLVQYRLFALNVSLASCTHIASLDILKSIGLRTETFGQLSYFERQLEYPRTQEIAEAAHFHGRDGLIVPSARANYPNIVVFCEPAGPAAIEIAHDHGLVAWAEWHQKPLGF